MNPYTHKRRAAYYRQVDAMKAYQMSHISQGRREDQVQFSGCILAACWVGLALLGIFCIAAAFIQYLQKP